LVGNGQILARAYRDRTVATIDVPLWAILPFLGGLLVLGVIAGLLTPHLPHGVPRRGFGVYTWIALLYGENILGDVRSLGIKRDMDLVEIEDRMKGVKVQYSATR
jgi:hypothetical protein